MASTSTFPEKAVESFPQAAEVLAPSTSTQSGFLASAASPLTNTYSRFSSWRSSLGLPNPGTVEGLQKEVKTTHLNNYIFDGARADLTKGLSMNPAFQVIHSFALGAQNSAPSYNFGAVFANNNIFMQGGVDHDGNLTARVNQGWSANNVSKLQAQIANSATGHSMLQLEHDYQGLDYSANVKAINPSPTDASGIYIGNYLQSLTPRFSLGVETLYQRPVAEAAEVTTSYLLKYTSAPSPALPPTPAGISDPAALSPGSLATNQWIATAQIQPIGIIQATFWQRLSEKVEFAADLQLIAAPTRRDAIATVGAKWDLRMSTMRAQLDSTGKVSALLEQRFAPTFAFLVAGEIDHFKNQAKVGLGIMLESSSFQEDMPPPPSGGLY